MKILVLSDSHSALSFMRRCIDAVKPDVMIHLGDYVKDGDAMADEYPNITCYQVPGNCDLRRLFEPMAEIVKVTIGGVRFYLTHGHLHNVKSYLGKLIADANAAGADIALFGHTHEAYCEQQDDGMWVMNPGSCGYYGGSVGYIEIVSGEIRQCRTLRETDLEEPF